jgi:hypothetical protein
VPCEILCPARQALLTSLCSHRASAAAYCMAAARASEAAVCILSWAVQLLLALLSLRLNGGIGFL